MGKDSDDQKALQQNPFFQKVISRYPDCPDLPDLPAVSKNWGESDFEVFVASMGAIVPSGAKKEAKPPPGTPEKSDKSAALFECAPRETPTKASKQAEGKKEDLGISPHASGESIVGEPRINDKGTASACLVIPSTLFMEDRAPEGLKLEAVLTKFDRCRAACLQSISGMSTFTLVKEYGVGILLADLSFNVETEVLPDLISDVFVESEIDLPKLPMLPSLQRLVDRSGKSSCTAVFGQMFVDMKSGMLSGNTEAYNIVKRPCDRVFGRDLPNSKTLAVRKELTTKWANVRPNRGKAFKPSRYLQGRYVIAPSDCDTYNTLYHPKAATVCEHGALSTGETFACRPCNAFFVKFLTTMLPGTSLVAHILVEDAGDLGTRALFAFEKSGDENSCVLTAFAVYGGAVPGVVYQEEFATVAPKAGQALAKWAKQENKSSAEAQALAQAIGCDVSSLS
jgi:hypothetical protein